jgi:hypothetical protein
MLKMSKKTLTIKLKLIQGTFSFVYMGSFLNNPDDKVALKYIIPTSAPTRTKQEIECLLNIGLVCYIIAINNH